MRRTRRNCLLLPRNPKKPLPNGLSLPSHQLEPRDLFPRSYPLVIKTEPRRLLPPLRSQFYREAITSSLSTTTMIIHSLRNPRLSRRVPLQSNPRSRTSPSWSSRNQDHLFYHRGPRDIHQPILFALEHPPRSHFQTLDPQRLTIRPRRNAAQVYLRQLRHQILVDLPHLLRDQVALPLRFRAVLLLAYAQSPSSRLHLSINLSLTCRRRRKGRKPRSLTPISRLH